MNNEGMVRSITNDMISKGDLVTFYKYGNTYIGRVTKVIREDKTIMVYSLNITKYYKKPDNWEYILIKGKKVVHNTFINIILGNIEDNIDEYAKSIIWGRL